jgi:hypothetical protein
VRGIFGEQAELLLLRERPVVGGTNVWHLCPIQPFD